MFEKTYDINKFYVGELYIAASIDSDDSDITKLILRDNLVRNGAIDFESGILTPRIDFEKGISYRGYLTIFYKSTTKLLCLHNNQKYNLKDLEDPIKNLVPLRSLLPKIDYKTKDQLRLSDALKIFDQLYHQNKFLYDGKIKVMTSDILVGGCLNCYAVDKSPREVVNTRNYVDLPVTSLKTNQSTTELLSLEDEAGKLSYYYSIADALFLNLDGRIINLFNNVEYDKMQIKNSISDHSLIELGLNYYHVNNNLEDYFNRLGIKFSKKMTIPKVLKLYNKYK